jgi:serine/threonine-protein kinase
LTAPAIGSTVGPYTLERLLGHGGFAWVYAAQRADGKPFAVKILKPRYASDEMFRSRFRQESEFAAQLAHPHIIHIEEVGEDPGQVYFSMDLYPDTMAALTDRNTVLDEAELAGLAADVGRALNFAHDKGVVHRDIKPDNVLISMDGRGVVTDFGIARAISGYVAATGFNMTMGTPHYISPEQAQGRPLDGRSDLYSLGITLYRAATGQLPFKSTDWFELARMHVETKPEPPRSHRPDLSRRMERVILKLLAKHPDDRYARAEEMLADLDDAGGNTRRTSQIDLPTEYVTKDMPRPMPDRRKWWQPKPKT